MITDEDLQLISSIIRKEVLKKIDEAKKHIENGDELASLKKRSDLMSLGHNIYLEIENNS